jgi:hypothetical protein
MYTSFVGTTAAAVAAVHVVTAAHVAAAAAAAVYVLQLVGQLDDVTEEEPEDLAPGPDSDTEDAAAQDDAAAAAAAPAATAAAVSAAAIAAAAVAGCESDSGSSNKSDGSAVPVRSMPVHITQRKVGGIEGVRFQVLTRNCKGKSLSMCSGWLLLSA